MIVSGFQPTVFVTNCLIQMYIKCSNMEYAHKVFDRMPQRDTVSWNAMVFGYAGSGCMSMAQMMFDLIPERDVVSWNSLISGYLQNGSCWKSVEVFMWIRREGVGLDATTFAVVLKACLGLEDYGLGVQIHGLVVQMGFVHDVVAGSATVDMYAKCKKLKESLSFFDEMPVKNWVSWSALIAGCVQNDDFMGGLKLFKNMQQKGLGVSQSTYASVFRSCAGLSALRFGSQLHAHSVKMNFGSDTIVGTATLDMYAKCGRLCDAKTLFRTLSIHNLQSYNAIIIGCARVDQGFEALQLFRDLVNTDLGFDDITLSGVFSACGVIKAYTFGVQLHGLTIKSMLCSNVCVENAILDMYGKCGALCEARWVFDEMEIRDAVSWNAIIAAYEQNGNIDETLHLLVWMLSSGLEPDEFTFGSVLKACAGLQALNYGMEIHGRIVKSGMGLEPFVGSTLVDMYCKCVKVEDAEKLHERMKEQTMVSWNAIISGCKEIYEKLNELISEMAFNDEEWTCLCTDFCFEVRSVFTEAVVLLFGIEDMSVSHAFPLANCIHTNRLVPRNLQHKKIVLLEIEIRLKSDYRMTIESRNPSNENRSRNRKQVIVDDNVPLLPTKKEEEDGGFEEFDGASFTGAVFNLSTTIVGAGIMALPATMKVLGLIPGIALIIFMAFLTEASIDLLVRFSRVRKSVSYGGLMEDEFGEVGRILLQVCVLVNNIGVLVVYMIIIGDVLSGTTSKGIHHAGVLQEWFGEHWWNGRFFILLVTTLFVFAPLASLKRIDSLRYTSALSMALAVVFLVIIAGITIFKLMIGGIMMPKLFPHMVDFASIFNLFTVVPILVTAYICHYNVHSIDNELEDHTQIKGVVRASLIVCSGVYIMTSLFGFLLFGDGTLDDVLANFDTDLGVPYSLFLNDIVRVSYAAHLILVFPIVFFPLRLNMDGLLFPNKRPLVLDTMRFASISTGLMVLVFLGANFIPNIWVAFEFTGATAAVCIGFIFPSAITLRDCYGIASKKDKILGVFMIALAVFSNLMAIYSNASALFSKNGSPPE
ncbi:hypothetical protein L6452_44425 [Arctium lappa]|uniref:Uncharacterized protein n=1 Tax=Arctium lappa TaxID=4217 RepID=A0ACB8XG52_ARCLA|nr:hypothetical protein L6452_44425 [Arctium lappa]